MLHVSGSCADTLESDQLLAGRLHENSLFRLNPTVEVCFQLRQRGRRRFKTSDQVVDDFGQGAIVKARGSDMAKTIQQDSGNGDDVYLRIGRRTAEDIECSLPARSLVAARIDTKKRKVVFLAVFTWRLNGLPVGDYSSGDVIEENGNFELAISMDPDPFWYARNLVSGPRIRQWLLGRVERGGLGEMGIDEEVVDDGEAAEERGKALEWRLAADLRRGRGYDYGIEPDEKDIRAFHDGLERFTCPWALPKDPRSQDVVFPRGIEQYKSYEHKWRGSAIDVVAVIINNCFDKNLRLPHHMQVTFEPDETLKQAKSYFWDGDEAFQGLVKNRVLARHQWKIELWVMPQAKGCRSLYPWHRVPELQAKDFCDPRMVGEDGAARLYVEVRIVQDPERLDGGEGVESSARSSDASG